MRDYNSVKFTGMPNQTFAAAKPNNSGGRVGTHTISAGMPTLSLVSSTSFFDYCPSLRRVFQCWLLFKVHLCAHFLFNVLAAYRCT